MNLTVISVYIHKEHKPSIKIAFYVITSERQLRPWSCCYENFERKNDGKHHHLLCLHIRTTRLPSIDVYNSIVESFNNFTV